MEPTLAADDPFDLADHPGARPSPEQDPKVCPMSPGTPHRDTAAAEDESVPHAPEPEPEPGRGDRPDPSGRLTPAQRTTFDRLLAVGADRPQSREGLVDELRERIHTQTADALGAWGQSVWFSKSQLTEAARCQGLIAANAALDDTPEASRPLHPATMAGIVAHRAIQISRTHPGEAPARYVAESIRAARTEDRFGATWEAFGDAERSDLQMAAVSKLVAFLDSWPPLRDEWVWRFEESTQARVGKLTLAARCDLVMGRPRPDGVQTMLLCDLKTGALGDFHEMEARFYALVAALRWGVPPFRSTVYSLASGDWTDPDVDERTLSLAADEVVAAVNARLTVLSEAAEPELTSGPWCRFCPAVDCLARPTGTDRS